MAKLKRAELIPSVGVLAAAIGCGVVAAFLVNLYIGRIEANYAGTAIHVLQLRRDVPAGKAIQRPDVKAVGVSRYFAKAFERAFKPEDIETLVGRQAPRNLKEGQVLYYGEFQEESVGELAVNPQMGYDLLTIPIETDNSPGRQLQPGYYVRIYAVFWRDPEQGKKGGQVTEEVIRNVQVRAVDGSTRPIPADKRTRYDNITILVTRGQAKTLLKLQNRMARKSFIVTVTHRPREMEALEPEINDVVLEYLSGSPGGSVR